MSDHESPDQEGVSRFVEQWTAALARQKELQKKNTFSAVLFRVNENLFALSTHTIREVLDIRQPHTVPHRSNEMFLGIVNLRGILHLCVNLAKVLKLQTHRATPTVQSKSQRNYPRMMVIEKDGKTWAFIVDEIISLQRFPAERVVPLVDKEKATKAILEWRGKTFDVLDEVRLFERLDDCV